MSYVGNHYLLVQNALTTDYAFRKMDTINNYALFEHHFRTKLLYEPTKIQICYNKDFISVDAYIRIPNLHDKLSEVAISLFSGRIIHEEFFYDLMDSLSIEHWVKTNGKGLYAYYCRSLGISTTVTPISQSDYQEMIKPV